MRSEWLAVLHKVGRNDLPEGASPAEGTASPVPLEQECVHLVPGTARRLVFLELRGCCRESQK